MENTIRKTATKITKEGAFILLTVVSAVILPQILHGVGAALGLGGALGQMLLPMYLPVLILGFYRGAVPGAIVGLLAPLVSFAITGMPDAAVLHFITVELVATGLVAGILAKVRFPAILRVLSVQIVSKIIRLSVHAISLYATVGAVSTSVIFAGILTSVPGILIQLALVTYLIIKKEC